MIEIEQQIEKYNEQLQELREVRNDAFNEKSDITISALGILLSELKSYIADLLEMAVRKNEDDKSVSGLIESKIEKAIEIFSRIQPATINVTPQLKFDLSLLQPALSKLGDQNNTLINLISKYNNNQNDNLLKLITSLVERQINFLDTEFKQIDITKELTEIKQAINNRPIEIKSTVTKRSNDNLRLVEEITSKIITK